MKKEQQIEEALIKKLQDLKYIYRPDIRDKAALACASGKTNWILKI